MKRLVIILTILLLIPAVVATYVEPDVVGSLESNDSVKVIVQYEDSFEVNQAIQSAQNIPEEDVLIDTKFKYTNGFAGNISSDGLDALQNDPKVKSIHLSRTYYTQLNEAVPLANVTVTHPLQIANLNLTGLGQTICILDTGINYSHESFGGCSPAKFAARTCDKVVNGTDVVNDDEDPVDDNGHGTHVAGIAAGNGSVIGVAPGARLAIVKVCSSGGSCSDANVIEGIEWCTDQAEEHNITVISMSLGDAGSYNATLCPTTFDAAVSAAVAKNITVLAASGNYNYTDGIASPACATNVVSVGSTYDADTTTKVWSIPTGGSCTDTSPKEDNLTCFSNRFSNLDILAPGALITSTSWTGGTEVRSGTSMSTPFAAGAIAVLQQYEFKENNRTLNFTHGGYILNRTGKILPDFTKSGFNLSRLNLYNAVLELDVRVPAIINQSQSVTNATSDSDVSISALIIDTFLNQTFLESDVNGTLLNYTLSNSSDNFSLTFNSSDLISGRTVNYKFIAIDINGNQNTSSHSFNVGSFITLVSPANNSAFNSSFVNITIIPTDSTNGTSNCSVYIDNQRNVTNQSSHSGNTTVLSLNLNEGLYDWHVDCNDSQGINISTAIRQVTVDTTYPALNLISPTHNQNLSSGSASFIYAVNDSNIANCSLVLANSVDQTDNSVENGSSNTFTKSLSEPSSTNWQVSCVDTANNINISVVRTVHVAADDDDSSSGSSGGGGGGGGGGSSTSSDETTTTEDDSDDSSSSTSTTSTTTVDQRFNLDSDGSSEVTLDKGSSKEFTLNEEAHKVTIKEVTKDSATIIIESDPIEVTLKVEETKEIDVDNDTVNDLSVTLLSIIDETVELKLEDLGNPSASEAPAESGNESRSFVEFLKDNRKTIIYSIIGLIVAIVIVLIFVAMMKDSFQRLESMKAKKGEIQMTRDAIDSKTGQKKN